MNPLNPLEDFVLSPKRALNPDLFASIQATMLQEKALKSSRFNTRQRFAIAAFSLLVICNIAVYKLSNSLESDQQKDLASFYLEEFYNE